MTRSLRIARSAATAYTVTFVVGSYLSIKRGYLARALGLNMGSDVRRGVLGGVQGAGLAAPWNLVVQMWIAVWLAPRADANGRRARAWLALLSALFVAGAVSEPVSHKIVTRELPPPDAVVALANIVLPIALLVAALASLVDGEGAGS